METFLFTSKITTGNDALKRLESFDKEKILIVADPFLKKNTFLDELPFYISDSNEYQFFTDILPDPPIGKVIDGIKATEGFEYTVLLAVGGGSAIDTAKAILYFMKKLNMVGTDPYFIVIPTTSGTGSEVTNFSIITDEEAGTKHPIVDDQILPDEALLYYPLVMNLPPEQTAATGFDVLTHALDAIASTKANDVSNALAFRAIELVFNYLPRAYKNGASDLEARENMHNASTLAGIAFNISSLGINHSLSHASGARFHIAHGRLNAIFMPEVINYNIRNIGQYDITEEEQQAINNYKIAANIIGINTKNDQVAINGLLREIIDLKRQLNLPNTLNGEGVERKTVESQITEIAQAALNDACTETNPLDPTLSDLEIIIMNVI